MDSHFHTNRNRVAPLPGSDSELPTLTGALLLCSSEIHRLLEEAGFRDIQPTDHPDAEHPQFLATREERQACICFAPLCDFVLDISHLSQEQCRICDTHYPERDVYYACLFCSGSGDERELELLGPEIVKRRGEWLNSDLQHSQYLPIAMRDGIDRYSSIFNSAVLFKLFQGIFPVITQRWDAPNFNIRNLFDSAPQGESEYLALRLFDAPTLLCIIQADHENKRFHYKRSLFLHCHGATSDLELVALPEEADAEDGQVELMEENGNYLLAECPEALLYPTRMQTSSRYLWFLSLVAENISPMQEEIRITSGPMFEMHCEDYRREHGCEPPEDYAFCLSMARMRSFMQDEGDTYATVIGQVVSISSDMVDGQPMNIYTICPMVDNDAVQLQVFVSPEIQGDLQPKEGDTIHASGYVYASAHELLVDAPSWQDSPEVGELQQERDNSLNSHRQYERLSRYSMGHAVAAAAFAGGGWQVEECNPHDIFSRNAPIRVVAQDGSEAMVCVDTVVNGQQPAFSYRELSDLPERIRERYGEDVACYLCTVKLDYNTAAERYAISMEMEPPCPGVENTLIYAAIPFRETTLSLNDGAPPTEKRLRPEQLNENMVAGLFRDAMAEGKWADFAEWMREEADFESATLQAQYSGKLSALRYLSERVEMWHQNPHTQWKDFSFATGSVIYRGKRRACTAMYYLGIPSAITVFDDAQGLIGHIQNLPWSDFCTYIQEETPYNKLLQKEDIPKTEKSVVRPPHASLTRCAAPSEPLQHVSDYLSSIGCTPVHCSKSAAAKPQIWFRDAEEKLCWAVLYSQDRLENEFGDTLNLRDAMRLKKLRHYPGYIISCSTSGTQECTEPSILPVDWQKWENL